MEGAKDVVITHLAAVPVFTTDEKMPGLKDTVFNPGIFKMVGVRGFELLTSCSQSRRATGLRYTPFKFKTPQQAACDVMRMASDL